MEICSKKILIEKLLKKSNDEIKTLKNLLLTYIILKFLNQIISSLQKVFGKILLINSQSTTGSIETNPEKKLKWI